MNLLLRILHLKRKPPNNTRNRTPQLRPRKVLPDTRPLPMQERDLREIRRRPAVIVRHGVPVLIRVDPALRHELLAVLAPEDGRAVDCVRADDEPRALGDGFPGDGCVADGFAYCDGHGWVQAEHFLADAVEEGEGFEIGVCDGG